MRCFAAAAALAGLVLASAGTRAPAADNEGWGTLTGRVVFAGQALPAKKVIRVTKDQEHCGAALPDPEWVVNPRNKGVANAFVWLLPEKMGGKLPVNPKLAKPSGKQPTLDQPRCAFVPHALALRQGQDLLVKNSAPVTHNIMWTGTPLKPGNSGNQTVAPGKSYTIKGLEAQRLPIKLACNIHPWMNGWVAVFDHPYFAVTDADGKFEIKGAPAGTYRLVVWQEAVGFRGGARGRNGEKITIKADGVTDLGNLGLKP